MEKKYERLMVKYNKEYSILKNNLNYIICVYIIISCYIIKC